MSFPALKWARAIEFDRSGKAVLVDLALRANSANECWPTCKTIARTLNVSKDTVERAVKRLRTTGLVSVRQQYDKRGRRTANRYQLNVGATPNKLGKEPIKTAQEAEPLSRTVPSTRPHDAGDRFTDQSMEGFKEKKKEAFNRSAKTDNTTCSAYEQVRNQAAGVGSRLPFTEATLKRVAGLGVDLKSLVERYLIKTRGTHIRHPCAYLLRMAEEEAAKAAGVTRDAIERVNSSSHAVRAAAFGSIMEGPFVPPSPEHIARLDRSLKQRGIDSAEMIARWKATQPKGCTTAATAARSLDAFVTNEIHRARDQSLHNSRMTRSSI